MTLACILLYRNDTLQFWNYNDKWKCFCSTLFDLFTCALVYIVIIFRYLFRWHFFCCTLGSHAISTVWSIYTKCTHTTNKAIVVFLLFYKIEDAFPIVHFSRNEVNLNDFSYSFTLSVSFLTVFISKFFGMENTWNYCQQKSHKHQTHSIFFLFTPELRVFLFEARALKQFQNKKKYKYKTKESKME